MCAVMLFAVRIAFAATAMTAVTAALATNPTNVKKSIICHMSVTTVLIAVTVLKTDISTQQSLLRFNPMSNYPRQ